MMKAEAALQPALIDFGVTNLTGVTHNRRYDISPYVHYDSVDPYLSILRIDDSLGNPLATFWNYGIFEY
jgi:hypothetical protein